VSHFKPSMRQNMHRETPHDELEFAANAGDQERGWIRRAGERMIEAR